MTGNPRQATRKRTPPGQGTRRTSAAARAVAALDLRLAGLDYAEIARRLGYADKSGAWKAVEGELNAVRRERAERVMALELERLDRLLAAVWSDALAGDRSAILTALRIMERRAKYLDLDSNPDLPPPADITVDGLMERIEMLRAEHDRRHVPPRAITP